LECIFRPTKGDNPAWARDSSLARLEYYNLAQPELAKEARREIPARPDSPNPAQPGRRGDGGLLQDGQAAQPGRQNPGPAGRLNPGPAGSRWHRPEAGRAGLEEVAARAGCTEAQPGG
jgi:hypothetical protein